MKSLYFLDPCAVMNDIYKHGPVVAAFAVYEDFVVYKKGCILFYYNRYSLYKFVLDEKNHLSGN